MSGDLLDAVVWDVRDDDPGLFGGLGIDVVHPDPVAGDDPAARQSSDQVRVDREVRVEKGVRTGSLLSHSRRRAISHLDRGRDPGQQAALDLETWKDLVRYDDLESRRDRAHPRRVTGQL